MTAMPAGRRPLTVTYRVQMNRAFTLRDALAIVPYLDSLGVSHLYTSPLLAARAGSAHGYDVIDPTRLNPELGTDEDLEALARALHERGMGLVLDIVPNHMATGPGNPYWDDVLTHGVRARHARWFDVDWRDGAGKVVLPVLGAELDAVLEKGELKLEIANGAGRIAYKGQSFPVDPATLSAEMQLALWDPEAIRDPNALVASVEGREGMRRLLDAQHYRLAFWRCAPDDLNYRRFFDVNDLVALRMEDHEVFAATHALVLAWVRQGIVDGLRVDHVDGLRDPLRYLVMLRKAVRSARPSGDDAFPIFVEKILTPGEDLRDEWPVQGTTGYDFLDDVEDAFVDPKGFASIETWYRRMRRLPDDSRFADCAHAAKLAVLGDALQPDVDRLVMLLRPIVVAEHRDWSDVRLREGVVHFIASLAVYRTYVDPRSEAMSDTDRRIVERAVAEANRRHPSTANVVEFIAGVVLGTAGMEEDLRATRVDFVARLQQTSGPAMAKGVEDTALYQYLPLASRNEVGSAPDRPLANAVDRLHAANARRRERWPESLICTTTHDTKRSADVRSRIEALSCVSRDWERCVMRWRRLNKRHRGVVKGRLAPDTNTEYLLYQTLLGIWPASANADSLPERDSLESARKRLEAYMLKAAREAKMRTSWVNPDGGYETALRNFIASVLDTDHSGEFLGDVARMAARIVPLAEATTLSRVLLHLTSPGVPDIYQGDESWNLALVDPDNRRPVAYDALAHGEPTEKLCLTRTLLALRREQADLFRRGAYVPLSAHGGLAGHLIAFARSLAGKSHAIVLAPRLWIAATRGTEVRSWGNTSVALPEGLRRLRWRSVLSGRDLPTYDADHLPVGEVLDGLQPGLLLSLE